VKGPRTWSVGRQECNPGKYRGPSGFESRPLLQCFVDAQYPSSKEGPITQQKGLLIRSVSREINRVARPFTQGFIHPLAHMTKPFKPLLSGVVDFDKLRFPLLASPKLDGIRCVMLDGKAVSRKLKAIPNDHIRELLESPAACLPDFLDGELLLRDTTAPFREVSSAVMKKTGTPDFVYAVFDIITAEGPSLPFAARNAALEWVVGDRVQRGHDWLLRVRQVEVADEVELMCLHQEWCSQGYEGTMVRDPKGIYKFGRSTTNQGILLKLKNWEDEEAEVIGIVEQMHNTNEAEKDNLGRTKRSTAKAGKVGKGTMGALKCRMLSDGAEFEVGTGFDDELRQKLWDDGYLTTGAIVKIKHQPDPGGRKDGQAPRFPVFLGFRNVEVD